MDLNSFNLFYKKLNPAQKDAVDAIEGPVMVVAGPGTGKTQILTLRIANILLKTQIEPENILALTFTEHAASSMRKRLTEIIGNPAYRVSIHTFHGFCNDIIRNHPDEFPRIIGSENITEAEQISLTQKCIESLPLNYLKPFGDPLYYLRPVISAINQLKREGLDPEGFFEVVKKEEVALESAEDIYHEKGPHKGKMKGDYLKLNKQINKNIELATIYKSYQTALLSRKFYDYNDMIMEVLKRLSTDQDLLLILQERYQYILVDEHQDTNNSQNKILELLCNFHPDPNIFIVGDEKQAIFRFQGASLQNFDYFKKLYPNARLIALAQNYRSQQTILDSAHSLIAGRKELQANASHPKENIRLYEFSNPDNEKNFVAREIKNKISSASVPPGEIAVLYRDNRDALWMMTALERAGVRFVVESEQNIFLDGDVQKLRLLLEAVADPGSEEKIFKAMHLDFLKINPLDVYRLARHLSETKTSIYDALVSETALGESSLDSPQNIMQFKKLFTELVISSKNDSLPVFFEKLMHDSGFLGNIIRLSAYVDKIGKINLFFDEVKNFSASREDATLADFLTYLDLLREHNVLSKKDHVLDNRVRLMTAHKSKGLEFDYVYIVDAYDGHWGNKKKFDSLSILPAAFAMGQTVHFSENDKNDDERRLFYVALTRARKGVAICYANKSGDGRDQLPSQFISELKSDYIDKIDVADYESELKVNPIFLTSRTGIQSFDSKDKDFVRQVFMQKGLSVTALNNYLKCPWNYFYNNLLRLPRAKTRYLMYGTAVHGALRDFFEKFKVGSGDKEYLFSRFKHHVARELFSKDEVPSILEKGRLALGGYFDTYRNSWHQNVMTEFSIRGIAISSEINLTGAIDKMEILNPSTTSTSSGQTSSGQVEVVVVDYKTGSPKTRGEIEGTTRLSSGDIKRQLVFYNLLLNKFKDGYYKMVSGDIDFIEPDERGKYRKESFNIMKDEISELENTIKIVSSEILSLDFWDRRCDQKDCEYCALREVMV